MVGTIKLIVGLGNPGPQYENTRHNAGIWFINHLLFSQSSQLKLDKKLQSYVAKINLYAHEMIVMVPDTFMNLSGDAVHKVAHFYKIDVDEMLVAHDELDLPAGDTRWKFSGGHGGHNGLRDICSKMGKADFYRLRIGIGRPERRHQVSNFVLHRPSQEEQRLIDDSIDAAANALPKLISGDLQAAMNELHGGGSSIKRNDQ